jgi:hypothetical protein
MERKKETDILYRLPVWFWTQFITMFMVLGATLSNNWAAFTLFRALQGLFGTVPQVVGLPIIHDMYHPEGWLFPPLILFSRSVTKIDLDWPRMINIWYDAQ